MRIVTKPVPNAPGYFARTDGTVWSSKKGNRSSKLRPSKDKSGYFQVIVCCDGHKAVKIHRMVLEAFVGPRPMGCECRHLNGDRTDNRLENIRWGTRDENVQDKIRHGTSGKGSQNSGAKLCDSQVREIRCRARRGERQADLARAFGMSPLVISKIVRRLAWQHLN